MNEKLLEEIGMTKGEIKVYFTLLKLGETTTGKIVEDAQISSGKIYEILDKLIRKGLVGYITKEKTKYFNAVSPNRILDYLKEKENDFKKKEEELLKEMPLLLTIQKSRKDYESQLFKGLKGMQTVIFEALDEINKDGIVLAFGVISKKDEKCNILWEKWHKERIRRKIRCRIIFSEKGNEYYDKFKKMVYTETKLLEGVTPTAIDVIGRRVLILTYGAEPSCLSILNDEISTSFTTFFETLWKIAR